MTLALLFFLLRLVLGVLFALLLLAAGVEYALERRDRRAMQVRAFVQTQAERVAGAIFIDPRSPEAVLACARELNWAGRHAVDVWLAGKLLRSLFDYQRLRDTVTQKVVEPAQVSAKHAWAALRCFLAFESSRVSDFDRAAFARIPAALITVSDPSERFGRLMFDAQQAAIEHAESRHVLLIHDVRHWELLSDDRSTRRIAEFIQGFCAYQATNISGGVRTVEPTMPACVAGKDITLIDAGGEQRMSSS